jgi:chemotaxis protein MotA
MDILVFVMGCATGAVMLQFPRKVLIRSLRMLPWMVLPPKNDPQESIKQILEWSDAARENGLLALEAAAESVPDPFLKKGLRMLASGVGAEKIRATLGQEIGAVECHDNHAAGVYAAASGYLTTAGILGAALGLIHVMGNLADPINLGGGIAVALVATVYGVGVANLFFLPVSNKLKGIVRNRAKLQEMQVDGLVDIAEGEKSRFIECRLQSHFAH